MRRGDKIAALQRRRDFLADRIASQDGDTDYDRAECSALTWALIILNAARLRGLLPDLEQR